MLSIRLLVLFIFFILTCMQGARNPTTVSFSGYIKYENWLDTRQIVSIRDGEYLLYPQSTQYDVLGIDINDKAQNNASLIQTRTQLLFATTLPYHIHSKGRLECDFFGISNCFPSYRIRHAYIEGEKNNITFLVGQTWQPLFICECYPDTVGFNTGAPIEVFSRQPQLRIGYKKGMHEIFFAAITQLETTSDGPLGSSTSYLKDDVIPNMHFQWLARNTNGSLLCAAVDMLRIVPRLVTNTGMATLESVTGMRFLVATKIIHKSLDLKLKALYVENGYDLTMLGGYAVRSINPITNASTYLPTRTCSLWADITLKKKIEPALFLGWSKNLGTTYPVMATADNGALLYTRNSNIDTVLRVAPRIRWYVDPLILACEVEWTRAYYGTINCYARAVDSKPVSNIRWMASLFYTF